MTRSVYLVAVIEWDVYHRSFEAASREEALALAEADWSDNGAEDWSFKDSGTDGFEIVDEEEVAL